MRGNGTMKGYSKTHRPLPKRLRADISIRGYRCAPPKYLCSNRRPAKDIIISGGENISSVEVEGTLMAHPAVSLCAVVAKPDEKWGEVPCAFIELKEGGEANEADLIAFARERLAGFKTPKAVVFCELPKTSTGKFRNLNCASSFNNHSDCLHENEGVALFKNTEQTLSFS